MYVNFLSQIQKLNSYITAWLDASCSPFRSSLLREKLKTGITFIFLLLPGSTESKRGPVHKLLSEPEVVRSDASSCGTGRVWNLGS